jgi:hypothetical protein
MQPALPRQMAPEVACESLTWLPKPQNESRCQSRPIGNSSAHNADVGERLGLSKTNARTASIRVNKFDAGGLESAADRKVIGRGDPRFANRDLRAPYGSQTHRRPIGELFSAPVQKRTAGPDLGADERRFSFLIHTVPYGIFSANQG